MLIGHLSVRGNPLSVLACMRSAAATRQQVGRARPWGRLPIGAGPTAHMHAQGEVRAMLEGGAAVPAEVQELCMRRRGGPAAGRELPRQREQANALLRPGGEVHYRVASQGCSGRVRVLLLVGACNATTAALACAPAPCMPRIMGQKRHYELCSRIFATLLMAPGCCAAPACPARSRRKAAGRLMVALRADAAEDAAALLDAEPRLAWVRDADSGGFAIHLAVWQARLAPARGEQRGGAGGARAGPRGFACRSAR